MKTEVNSVVVGAVGTVKKWMVENIKKVSERERDCDRDPKDLRVGICMNPQEGA